MEITQYSGLFKQRERAFSLPAPGNKQAKFNLPVEELVGVVGEVGRREGSGVARGEAEAHAADVDRLGLHDLHDPRLAGHDGPRRHHVAVAELGVVAHRRPAVGPHADVDAVRARVQRERLERVVPVVAERRRRREVLHHGRRRDGRQRQRRQLGPVQVERVHRHEQVRLAVRPRDVLLLLLLLLLVVVVLVVGPVHLDHGAHAAARVARVQTRGAAARRRVAHRVIVESAPWVWNRRHVNQ